MEAGEGCIHSFRIVSPNVTARRLKCVLRHVRLSVTEQSVTLDIFKCIVPFPGIVKERLDLGLN